MGLDIQVVGDNNEELEFIASENEEEDLFNKHSLSRTFCNFMCRRDVVEHETELEQIARITGIDVSPLYEMENSHSDESLSLTFKIFAKEDDDWDAFSRKSEETKSKISGNIDRVLLLLHNLIQKLSGMENLPALLIQTDFDTLGNAEYFSDFPLDKGEGYIGNNFGQDLRNFQRFLEFAKQNGTSTVWFDYG